MTPASFAAIVDKVKEHTDYLSLHVLGEPLLHPELGTFLDLCHRQQLRVNLTTNGTLLAQCLETLLVSPALRQVNVSLHSLSEHVDGANLETYLVDLLGVVRRLTVETDTCVSLRLWNEMLVGNDDAAADLNPVHAVLEKHFDLPGRLSEIPIGRGFALAHKIYLSRTERFNWPHLPGPDLGSQGTCRGLKDHLAILVDGTVVPCCLDGEGDIVLGNIITQSMAEILAGPRATAMINSAARQKFVEPLCRRCSFRQRF